MKHGPALNTNISLACPKLRRGVRIVTGDTGVELAYREQGVALAVSAEHQGALLALLQRLEQGNRTADELKAECAELAEDLDDLLLRLDIQGLLTEGRPPAPEQVLTGREFYRKTVRFRQSILASHPGEPFVTALTDGSATRNLLIGYALEYFHIVSRCPAILAPALSNHETRRTERLLREFYLSEFEHDKLLRASLGSVGFVDAELDSMIPLPTTFAVYSALAVYARQHPLSFKCSLFLFEEPAPEFNRLFVQRCRELDLPPAFYEPVLEHAEVNDGAQHDAISELLLEEISSISREDQLVALKHLGTSCENLLRQEAEIVSYYNRADARVPRIWSEGGTRAA